MLADRYAPVEKKTILIPPPPLLTMAREVTAVLRQETRAKLGFSQEHVVFVSFGYINLQKEWRRFSMRSVLLAKNKGILGPY